MDDLEKIIITSSLTVISGVFVFTIGKLIEKFVIDPIHELKKSLCEIQFSLAFHAQAILTPSGNVEKEDEAQKELRKASCELRSKVAAIPFYGFWSFISFRSIPSKKKSIEASKQIMGLSNSVHQNDRSEKNGERISRIEKLLNYEPTD